MSSGHPGVDPSSAGPDTDPGAGTADDRADVGLVVRAIADEEELLAFCQRARTRHRALATQLDPLVGRQRRHVKVLRGALSDLHPRPATGSAGVPASIVATLTSLRRLSERNADKRRHECLAASSGRLARLLASVSASHAMTVESLASRQ